MNKKGYIKTLEAVIAIVAILIFTFGVTPRETPDTAGVPFVVKNAQDYITNAIANDEYLRLQLLNATVPTETERLNPDFPGYHPTYIPPNTSVSNLVTNNLPPGYNHEFKICKETTCLAANPPLEASVYSDDVIIAGINTAGDTKVRIVRFWFWSLG